MVSDIPVGDGKMANLFYSVQYSCLWRRCIIYTAMEALKGMPAGAAHLEQRPIIAAGIYAVVLNHTMCHSNQARTRSRIPYNFVEVSGHNLESFQP